MNTKDENNINKNENLPSEHNEIRARILSYVTNSSPSVEIGIINFKTAPLVGDVIFVPTHPPLRVLWRRFVQEDVNSDITIACGYAELQNTEPAPIKNMDIKEYKEAQIEIQTKTFDKATTYTNAVIIAGYAAAFTIWSNVIDKISDQHNAIIGLLISVSFIFFILFEISKMILSSIFLKRIIENLRRDEKSENYMDTIIQANKKIGSESALFMKLWPFALILTITPGIIATIYLFYDFFTIIFKEN